MKLRKEMWNKVKFENMASLIGDGFIVADWENIKDNYALVYMPFEPNARLTAGEDGLVVKRGI